MSGADSSKALPESSTASEKKPAIIELKNGKVVCKQKPISFEKQSETLQEIVKFREMLEERIEGEKPPLGEVSDEHKPVIVKLAHESDKGLTALAKHIRQELLPVQDEDDEDKAKKANDSLPQAVVEAAINSLLDRNNYGLDAPSGSKLPASLTVWRWEVKDQYKDWLPKSARERAETRLEERKQAKQALIAVYDALPQSEKDSMFSTKGGDASKKMKDSNKAPASTPDPGEKDEIIVIDSAKKKGKKKATEAENEVTEVPQPAKPKKPVDPEKAAKEKERLEKKAAKLEKEQKARDAQNKSRSIMANFFGKAKPAASSSASPSKSANASTSQSEFDRVFKPFVLKKDSVLAPQNWFLENKKRRQKAQVVCDDTEVIVIDDEESVSGDVEMLDGPELTANELSKLSNKERLDSILSSMPPSLDPRRLPRRRLPSGYKVYHPTSVRDILSQLSEAEVAGDDTLVRVLLAKLQDRKLFPVKAFIFHEDARPGYFGTWTRNSKVIGPRRPLARDLLTFDYGYDSGEEWEEEPVGDDVADDDEDDNETEDHDSDADSWLVDDHEEVEVDLRDLDSYEVPDLFDLPAPVPIAKRKSEDGERKMSKKRKVVVPLVPFAKGPCWEEKVGQCSYEPFNQYRIQLFNDTPFPIDPFTFESTCVEDFREYKATLQKQANPGTTQDGFVVPSLPARLNGTDPIAANGQGPAATTTSSSTPTPASSTNTLQPKKPLKTPFPDAHLPHLVNKIMQLDTGSFNLLVELIYEDLKGNKVTKAAIEAKIREVGEKVKKKWVVKAGWMGLVSTNGTNASAASGTEISVSS